MPLGRAPNLLSWLRLPFLVWTVAAAALGRTSIGQSPRLPPVPSVHGPLAIRVVYPAPTDQVEVEDSSFIVGSIGDGDATLTINGRRVPVAPNGGFLAWLPYPAGSPARFTLVARKGQESTSSELVVRRTARFTPADSTGAWIDTTSFAPRGRVWWPAGEALALSVRAAPGSKVSLVLPGGRRVPFAAMPGVLPPPDPVLAFERDSAKLRRARPEERYQGLVRGLALGEGLGPVLDGGESASRPQPAKGAPCCGPAPVMIEAVRGRDTVRAVWPLRIALLDSFPPAAMLERGRSRRGGGSADSVVVGRSRPGATYHWFFPTGTVAAVAGRVNDDLRLALSRGSEAWVAAEDAIAAPSAIVAGRATVGSITIVPGPDRVQVRIPVSRRVPYFVDENADVLRVTIYGAAGDVNWLRYGGADSLIERAAWRQRAGDEVDLEVDLTRPVFGYRTRWDGGALVLEIRRPPAVERGRPLVGRLIVVDPGHPPVGSTGPTGLTEPEANLGVANELGPMLEDLGARVLSTRTDARPIELGDRVRFADSVGADLLVSIHNNALPDGLNPFVNNGSSTFYFHPRSLPLARKIQARLVEELGQRDLGVARADLALARPTWMPAVLVEGLFMMVPEHEAALRDPEGRRRYARAVARGIEEYFASWSERR
jgi:N-acetylmuramoyl-L-alanine amidase